MKDTLFLAIVAGVLGATFWFGSTASRGYAVALTETPSLRDASIAQETIPADVSSPYDRDMRISDVDGHRVSDRFSNISLIDQHGNSLRFYDDLIQDRSVCIVFFYTRCTGSCPTTTVKLKQLRRQLAKDFEGQGLTFVSLTLEPFVDTPEELREYMDRYSIEENEDLPRWVYATGDFEELDKVRRQLGVYDLDPVIDADKTEHAAIVTFGNDRTDRWAALPIDMGVDKVAETMRRICGNTVNQRYFSSK